MAKILFIEDEPALQKALGDFLQRQGYEVTAALNGADGLDAARRNRPDLILLDLILPRLSGMEVLRRVREEPGLSAVPVIVLTNVESSEAVEQAVALGARAYLVKTNYRLEEVLEKVKAALKDSASAFEPER